MGKTNVRILKKKKRQVFGDSNRTHTFGTRQGRVSKTHSHPVISFGIDNPSQEEMGQARRNIYVIPKWKKKNCYWANLEHGAGEIWNDLNNWV